MRIFCIFFISFFLLLGVQQSKAQYISRWYKKESEHFTVVYREPHAHLVPHIIRSAEKALQVIMKIMNYTPTEKIVINTYDFSDYGSAGTTTVPHNFIRLEIEPFELDYETMPFNERLQWLLSHELVHIAMNDQASNMERVSRSLFSKVPPEKNQPISILFSLLTNFARYTPRWHQEGIAVFLETWLNGGFGRMLSNFDEMYFRALVLEKKKFDSPLQLDGRETHTSFLLEMLFYLYGERFISYLAIHYGQAKVIDWFTIHPGDNYVSFEKKFKSTFGLDFMQGWDDFIQYEKQFQQKNIARLQTAELTPIKRLQQKSFGWVTQPYYDSQHHTIIFANHQAHNLTAVNRLNLESGKIKKIGTLPSPSMIQIASTTYDQDLRLFFYTTNNNQLFRDVWVLNCRSQKIKQLFPNSRVGQLTISKQTHELWGVQHSGGKPGIVYSENPFHRLKPTVEFDVGDDLQHLAISPDGKYLAATLHRANGKQAIILADCNQLKTNYRFRYQSIYGDGAPEHPSWSPDGKFIYWNAYTNGVSNIYRYQVDSKRVEALSHTLTGLFRPIYVNQDTLFAFEFTTTGFVPVLIPNRPAKRLPAIEYQGQRIIENNPELAGWSLPIEKARPDSISQKGLIKYSGLSHLEFQSFIPVITGFQTQKVLGFYTHISDPLFIHDITLEAGYSPFNESPVMPTYHIKGKYEFRKRYSIGINHNAPDFYDLFNNRKRGMIGTKITLGNTHYWKYDNPHKIKQNSELSIYTGIEAINDNLVRVSKPDFFVLQTILNSSNTRRSIGSTDKEHGSDWQATVMIFGVDPRDFQLVGGFHLEWDHYTTWAWRHNILHVKLAAGLRRTKDRLAIGKFYFGGFGNRTIENAEAKQFRKVFRFPGIPIYSVSARRFAKIMIEHNLPPLRLAKFEIASQYINHIDASWYTQSLLIKSDFDPAWIDIGAQANIVFKHWYNLESTLSFGVANTWYRNGQSWEWFISYKLLK